jgi:serine protease Do
MSKILFATVVFLANLASCTSIEKTSSFSVSKRPVELDAAAIFRKSQHSVVSIKVHRRSQFSTQEYEKTLQSLRDLCGQNIDECISAMEETSIASSLGTGFFIDDNGLTLTAAHVVEGAERVYLRLANFQTISAAVVGRDPQNDLAILRPIRPLKTIPVSLGDSRHVQIGDPLISIGAPFGMSGSLTLGRVSGKDRQVSEHEEMPFLQSDVVVNPGNSGGPLFDSDGRVVALTSRTLTNLGEYSGIAFAIPIELAMLVVNDLLEEHSPTRGRADAKIGDVPPEMMELISAPDSLGVFIISVVEKGLFARAGIKAGDIIRSFDGTKINHVGQFSRLLFELPRGKQVQLEIWRIGGSIERMLSIGAQ